MYKLTFKKSAAKELEKVPKTHYVNVRDRIKDLENDPRPSGCTKLKGSDQETYRIRVADYRVVYNVNDNIEIVTITRIRHRKEVYR